MARNIEAAGGDVPVNTETGSWQYTPAVAALSGGGFVVAWGDDSLAGGDADTSGIKAQVFGVDGDKVGAELLVNTTTVAGQYTPAIAALPGGGFVVAWDDYSGAGGDANGGAVKAQAFDAGGSKVGGEMLVNTSTAGWQHEPAVTALAGGGFLVTWDDWSGAGDDASDAGIKAQLFDAAGQPVGGETLVNTATAAGQTGSAVAGLPGGGFVVAWADRSGAGGDADGTRAQLFDANGNSVGGEVQINAVTAGQQYDPVVAALADGRLVVGWTDGSGRNGDADRSGIVARLFEVMDPNAAPVAAGGGRTALEDALVLGQVAAADADGDALTYTLVQGARDANGHAVAGLTFNADGTYAFQGPQDFHGAVTFAYVESDGTAVSNTATVALTVAPVNDAPVAPALANRFSPEDGPLAFTVPAFTDADDDALAYAATLDGGAPLPAWLAFDAATRTFSGTPPADLNGALDLTVRAADGQASASATLTLAIDPVDDAPVAAVLSDRTLAEDRPVSFQVPAFMDLDGDALTYAATLADGARLPAWLTFDAATRTFSGARPANWSGTLAVRVSASDGAGSASDGFQLTISPVNDAPVAPALADRALPEDQPLSFQVPAFADVDGDALAYAARLASGGRFRPGSRSMRPPGPSRVSHPQIGLACWTSPSPRATARPWRRARSGSASPR